MLKRVALGILLAAVPAGAAAQIQAPPQISHSLTIPRVSVPPTLEDYLDGVPRPEEAAVTAFFQREPGDGVPASQPTEAYVSYDDRNLYVVFIARDREPDRVRATLTRREGFSNNDFVGVVLDTFHDRRRAYLFIANPLGVQLDGIAAEGQRDDDYSFDAVWHSEGRLTPFGYVVWMAIPFQSLRFSADAHQEWGIALSRAIQRNNETSFWPYITRRVSGFGQQLATARGLHDISPGRNVQLIPYSVLTRARFLDAERPAYVTDRDLRAGVNAKMVLKDAFTVDLTLNPDFSQVESDEPQVTINQRFEVFFPEKRPFFIENASYFQTPIDLFFSRRVADPELGARLTGKKAGWGVAALAIDDRAPGQRAAPSDPAFGDRAGIGVFRLQRDFAEQSNVGFMATTRSFGAGDTQVFSADARYKVSDTLVLTAQAAASRSRPAAGGANNTGHAFSLELDRTSRNWGAFLRYEALSPEFRAPLGFVRRVDMRQLRPFSRYTWFPQTKGLVSIRPELSGRALWDYQGILQDWEVDSEVQVEFTGPTTIEVGHSQSMERFGGTEFRRRGTGVEVETAWLKWLELSVDTGASLDVVYEPAPGLLPYVANARGVEASLTLKPVAPLRIDQAYFFTRLRTREPQASAPAGALIVDNHILRTRAAYQFTRELSLRVIVDYSAVLPDRGLIALQRDKRFTGDVLLTYLLNPWTAVYAGYTDGYANVEIDPLRPDRLRPTEGPFHSTGRQVFLKVSYLLRF